MNELPKIEREGNGYRVTPQQPLPRSWLNAGTMMGVSVAGTALLAATLLGPVMGAGLVLNSMLGAALSVGGIIGGGLVGNMIHQRQVSRAEREGILLEDPGFFNRGFFAGAMQGFGKAGWITLGATIVGLIGGLAAPSWFGAVPAGMTAVSHAIATSIGAVALPALVIGVGLAAYSAVKGSREQRVAIEQQISNIENGIIYREAALARGQQPELDTARSAALANSAGVAAGASPVLAAKTGALPGVGIPGLGAQEQQFTPYAYNGPAEAHPAFHRDPNARWADHVRPQRSAPAVVQATPAVSSAEAQRFTERVNAVREQMANAQATPSQA
jgi:hypothetical protein